MVNYERFFENTSSTEAFLECLEQKINFKKLLNQCWNYDCKKEVKKLIFNSKKIGYEKVRKNCMKAVNRRGYYMNNGLY